MAIDYSVETRVRKLISDHEQAGATPRTLVMSYDTWQQLVWELDGRGYANGLYWTPQQEGALLDPKGCTHTYYGVPILIKDFVPFQEIIIGV